MTSLCQFSFCRGGANHEFRAAFVVMTAACVRTVDFHGELAQPIAILAQLRFDGIAALRRFAMLAFQLLHGFCAMLHVLSEGVELGVELRALLLDCGKLAGQDNAQLGSHLVTQLSEALCLRGLTLQRIHLPRDFVKNIVDSCEVQFGIFQASFREALLGFEFRNSRRLFENRAAVGGTAAENLADAALFDERVSFGSEAGAHE